MPTSSSAATIEKKKTLRVLNHTKSIEQNESKSTEKNLLKIASALPSTDKRTLYVRSHSTLNVGSIVKVPEPVPYDSVTLHSSPDGAIHVSRTQNEKEKNPDRISLDRRGLTSIPIINGEPKLRLLSLQHNLINDLEPFTKQAYPMLVFLDFYDNQLEHIKFLDYLENLRVLLMGKNRLKKIEGLEKLKKLEVLDFHGNQIVHVGGLNSMCDLKVLNLAGNQIRNIGAKDLQGLESLQELNLRRNRLRKLLGFAETPSLSKLFLSNNDLQCVEDISSLAKSQNLKEISIDNNPVSLGGDCVSFLVSYLPHLAKLNSMQITEQVKKSAMTWRRNKETTNAAFMDLTSETTLNCKREEVISNARTNWELLRSQTKCLTTSVNSVDKSLKNLKPDSDFVLTSLTKPNIKQVVKTKPKLYPKIPTKVPILPDKKFNLVRTSSQDTENSQNTSSSNNSGNEFFKLPPILVPIINKIEQCERKEGSLRMSESLSSIGPNVDSLSSLASGSDAVHSSSSSSASSDTESETDLEGKNVGSNNKEVATIQYTTEPPKMPSNNTTDSSSNLSTNTTKSNVSNVSFPSTSGSEATNTRSSTRNVKSAVNGRSVPPKSHIRATTAKIKKQTSPALPKDREQGGDYLIEVCGRHLNIYGQGALRFIDKPWNSNKANDVNTVKFNYVNFNSIVGILNKLKQRFPNVEHFIFKETNITCIGQLNALSELQGLVSLHIDPEGNPICQKNWESYAIYRLSHWGLKYINNVEITDEDKTQANEEYQSLSDLVFWSLPDILLQPLLTRLRIDISSGISGHDAKKWLLTADPELKSVVSKEALQWKKGSASQEDIVIRQKAKQYMSGLLDETINAMNKLKILDQQWPSIMHDFVRNTLLDYSQLDIYMKQKIQELNK